MTSPAALAAAIATSRCCCDIMALLTQDENIATKMRRMHLADIAVCPGLGGGELDGHLGFRLHHLFNLKVFDLKAMGVIQLIDEGEFNLVTLLDHQTGGQPDLRTIEEHINQSELLGFSRCCESYAQDQYCKKHTQPT